MNYFSPLHSPWFLLHYFTNHFVYFWNAFHVVHAHFLELCNKIQSNRITEVSEENFMENFSSKLLFPVNIVESYCNLSNGVLLNLSFSSYFKVCVEVALSNFKCTSKNVTRIKSWKTLYVVQKMFNKIFQQFMLIYLELSSLLINPFPTLSCDVNYISSITRPIEKRNNSLVR